jgi:hypothetical protein
MVASICGKWYSVTSAITGSPVAFVSIVSSKVAGEPDGVPNPDAVPEYSQLI